jgi:hypothetical protein
MEKLEAFSLLDRSREPPDGEDAGKVEQRPCPARDGNAFAQGPVSGHETARIVEPDAPAGDRPSTVTSGGP